MSIVIGSRGSQLALWQAHHVSRLLQTAHPGLEVSLQIIKTTGDKLTQVALAQIADGKGVFVKEIEEALLAREIDLAVHSLKDVPTQLPEGLTLAAILPREDPRDVVIGPGKFQRLDQFPQGARLATGSMRRTVQLRHWRPDFEVLPIRGNVDTRIRKMEEQGLDGVVLALAGIRRLGLQERIAYTFSLEEMLPAVGQGALAVETRAGDDATLELLEPVQDQNVRRCVEAERAFLLDMGGGCQVPLGAHAQISGDQASFAAFVADPSNGLMLRQARKGRPKEILELARQASQELLQQGARDIIQALDWAPLHPRSQS